MTNQVTRVPVVDTVGKPLMPTTPSRARKWIKYGKAIPKRNKLGVFYVQLTGERVYQNNCQPLLPHPEVARLDPNCLKAGNCSDIIGNPSRYEMQPIVAGTDRVKAFTGIAFQSKLATIVVFHLCLPGFYKTKKNSKDRQSVTGKMNKRTERRRSRRARRINRTKAFKLRNHREKRVSNRRQNKLPPSILANRLMELRVLTEMSKILPLTEIRDENCGGNTKRNGIGISPVTVGQEWFRTQASKIAPVVNVDSKTTGSYREQLGLIKDRKDKSKQTIETHGNDAIALASGAFIAYKAFSRGRNHGHVWFGKCVVTPAPFIVLTRPKLFRRKLHQEQWFSKIAVPRILR